MKRKRKLVPPPHPDARLYWVWIEMVQPPLCATHHPLPCPKDECWQPKQVAHLAEEV